MRLTNLGAATLLLSVLCVPALASPFQYGDLFATTSSGILRYNQAGTLLQTIAGGGIGLAFDPQGNLYTASGASIQKYDNSGNPLGTFVSGFPGTLGSATGIDFDAAGNAYVAGIQDLNFDFINSYTGAGAPIHTVSFLQGQENWVYIDAAGSDSLLVTPGTTSVIDKFIASTLAPNGSIFNAAGGPNGGIEGLAGGGFLVITGNTIEQFNAAGTVVFNYNTVVPTHGTWIGVDSITPSSFWAVTDFGEFYNFNLGTATPVSGFNAAVSAKDLTVYTLPEPSTVLLVFGGVAAVVIRKRARAR
jgi:hypothetical protein